VLHVPPELLEAGESSGGKGKIEAGPARCPPSSAEKIQKERHFRVFNEAPGLCSAPRVPFPAGT